MQSYRVYASFLLQSSSLGYGKKNAHAIKQDIFLQNIHFSRILNKVAATSNRREHAFHSELS